VVGEQALTAAGALAALNDGRELPEGELLRLLRSPQCPAALVERLAGCRWVLRLRRPLAAMLRHPACPRTFAWDALPRLGWNDLLAVSRDPRASPAVRKQAERRLVERLPKLSVGERVTIARTAPRGILAAVVKCAEERSLAALLDNPQLTEVDALRIMATCERPGCLVEVLHHRTWGVRSSVVRAALRNRALPLGVALGLAAALAPGELRALVESDDLSAELQGRVSELLARSRPN